MSDLETAYGDAARAIAAAAKILVTTHESPDGDAIGSLLGATAGLRALGKDVVPFAAGETPMPQEYRWLDTDSIPRALPDDVEERLLLAVDCGSAQRLGRVDGLLDRVTSVVNVDHHHDNTRFGVVNVVDPVAPCAALMVHRLLGRLGAPITPAVAIPLYVGLVTDTGRFQYANVTPEAFQLAAELVAGAGIKPAEIFRQVYENVPLAKARLLGLALSRLDSRLDGRLLVTVLRRDDFEAVGAPDPFSEGVIDHLRAIDGVAVAALVREPREKDGPAWKVSLRSAAADVDVSRIARAGGGGGHVQAAGFSSDLPLDELLAFLEAEVGAGG